MTILVINYFGLVSYGWIPKSNILPYPEYKEKFKLDNYQYFFSFDKISATLFLLVVQKIDDYFKKTHVINSGKDGPEKEKLLRESTIKAKKFYGDLGRLRNCDSMVWPID